MKDTTITVENMSQLVSNTFKECLFKEGEDTSNYVIGEGIKNNFGFNPQRLEQHRELVTAILNELPDDFKKGYTFFLAFVSIKMVSCGQVNTEFVNN